MTYSIENNDFYFSIQSDGGIWDNIASNYSPFYNITSFCGDHGEIYFIVSHSTHKLYDYYAGQSNGNIKLWRDHNKPELEEDWLIDGTYNLCEELDLTKENLLLVFEHMLDLTQFF